LQIEYALQIYFANYIIRHGVSLPKQYCKHKKQQKENQTITSTAIAGLLQLQGFCVQD
jgi:hypothetical protein